MNSQISEVLMLLLPRSHNIRLVRELADAGVEFLVVGGVAVAAYGCRDISEVDDLDLLINPTIENAQRLMIALDTAQVANPTFMQPEIFAKPALQIPIKQHYYAELLTPRIGYDFATMQENGTSGSVAGLTLKLVSIDDLVRMKMDAAADPKAGTNKHQQDLDCLLRKR